MKIRTCFISNSSSSSFIFMDDGFIRDFSISKSDLIEALSDLYGKNQYDEYIKANGHPPFVVYDMKCQDEAAYAHSQYDRLLEVWDCERLYYVNVNNNKKFYLDDGWHLNCYKKIIDTLANIFHLDICGSLHQDDQIQTMSMFIWTDNHTRKRVAAPQCIKDIIAMTRAKLGILTNKDVLYQQFTKFFLHFDENEVDALDGMTIASRKEEKRKEKDKWDIKHNKEIESSIFDTNPYSFDRFCEVLFNWLLSHGKISKSAVRDGVFPYWLISDSICACTMHEG